MSMDIPKEFKPLIVPKYQPATRGEWSLAKRNVKGAPRNVLAYYRDDVPMPKDNWVLMQNRTVWMSLTPMELESQGFHGRMATGHVLVAGLGMGALVHHLLTYNSKVTKVTVVDQNANVVEILKAATDWCVPGARLQIIIDDARQFRPNEPVNTLLVDIWPGLGGPNAESDTRAIQKNVRANVVAWWGQELDLISFVYNSGRKVPITRQDMRLHEEYLGFPVLGYQHPAYGGLATVAAGHVAGVMIQKQRSTPGMSISTRMNGPKEDGAELVLSKPAWDL